MAPKKAAKKKVKEGAVTASRQTFQQKIDELRPNLPAVQFSVTIRARCHPGTMDKVKFSFDWFAIDAKTQEVDWKPADGLPKSLLEYEKNEAASDDKTEVGGDVFGSVFVFW